MLPVPPTNPPEVLVEKSTVYVAGAPAVRGVGEAVTPVTEDA